ncbi:MAG: thioredoxin [Ruminococcaceae bacterium]|nr:thioredoxin [Oscillospiraceae bacterium]
MPAWLPGVILLGIAVAALIVGAVSGGAVPVLAKAVKICTECIGLG